MKRLSLLVLALCCVQGVLGQGQTRVSVHAEHELGPVNRLLFGANQAACHDGDALYRMRGAGIWNPNTRTSVPDYVDAAKECGLSLSRWPGSCAAQHTWNWKETVGPVDHRPEQAFGLPEFMTWCRDTQSLPFITVAAYWGTEKEAADLVEYLNAPHDGQNPNGGTDWAAVRAADGHAPPYGVVWFELDGEAYHGEHVAVPGSAAPRRLTPREYARRYLRTRDAMRAVDRNVKLGAAVPCTVESWSHTVLTEIGDKMDFAVTRLLLPTWERDASPEQSGVLLQASLAAAAQVDALWDRLNAMVTETCDRTDLPWAITDIGNQYVQEKPVPYRQSLAAALGQAELLRVLLNSRHRVALAAFRQFANRDWGMIQGYTHLLEPLRPQAVASVYGLYAQHFGDTLLEVTSTGDRWDFAGAADVLPRSGSTPTRAVESAELLPKGTTWAVESLPGVPQKATGALLLVKFPDRDLDYWHASVTLPAKPNLWYRIRGLIKTENLTGSQGACLEVSDGQTGAAAKPPVISDDILGTADWTEVVLDYRAPADAEQMLITARRHGRNGGTDAVSGKAYFRLFSVRELTPANCAAVPDVSATAASRKDGTLTVILVNTNTERDQLVSLEVAGVPLKPTAEARVWLLHAPTPWTSNLGREEKVRLWMPQANRQETGWEITLPKHSMAAVEIKP